MLKKIFVILLFLTTPSFSFSPLYFVTAADENHFDLLKSLIGSIHKTNFDHLGEIAVYDLGFTKEQCSELARMQKVTVNNIEQRHPDILKLFKVFPDGYIFPNGKNARGWYAWKPVAIKQALDKFPYVVWQDASNVILKPVDHLFEHIRQNGYFLLGYKNKIRDFTPRTIAEKFGLYETDRQWVLDSTQIEACTIGVCKSNDRAYNQFLMFVYGLTNDIHTFFADDGTAPNGFGRSRHDQTVFSIAARLLNMEVMLTNHRPTQMYLTIDGKKIPFYADWGGYTQETELFYACRGRLSFEHEIRYEDL